MDQFLDVTEDMIEDGTNGMSGFSCNHAIGGCVSTTVWAVDPILNLKIQIWRRLKLDSSASIFAHLTKSSWRCYYYKSMLRWSRVAMWLKGFLVIPKPHLQYPSWVQCVKPISVVVRHVKSMFQMGVGKVIALRSWLMDTMEGRNRTNGKSGFRRDRTKVDAVDLCPIPRTPMADRTLHVCNYKEGFI